MSWQRGCSDSRHQRLHRKRRDNFRAFERRVKQTRQKAKWLQET